ncbi:MAG: hypothetical protein EOP84_24505 [Verrucomicrobiaceae bacterium]|nr:MAG: hypothetical protein EOP84_24505 [Verrucomicrobiaceae bacterium]
MEPYNVIAGEDQPRNAEERAAMVSHSVAMIERMNAAIARPHYAARARVTHAAGWQSLAAQTARQ